MEFAELETGKTLDLGWTQREKEWGGVAMKFRIQFSSYGCATIDIQYTGIHVNTHVLIIKLEKILNVKLVGTRSLSEVSQLL